jgi:hypothetical protein
MARRAELACLECEQPFRPKETKQRFCSRSCSSKNRIRQPEFQAVIHSAAARAKKAEAFRGEKNPMAGKVGAANPAFRTGRWVGIKPARRQRGTKCEQCGAPERLDVHHKDGNRANNDPSNLATLCHRCHLRQHASERSGPYRNRGGRSGERKGSVKKYVCPDCGEFRSRQAARCRGCAYRRRQVEIACEFCGIVKLIPRSHAVRGAEHHFCSNACRGLYWRKHGRPW